MADKKDDEDWSQVAIDNTTRALGGPIDALIRAAIRQQLTDATDPAKLVIAVQAFQRLVVGLNPDATAAVLSAWLRAVVLPLVEGQP